MQQPEAEAVALNPALGSAAQRSTAVASVLGMLRGEGKISGWRNELYPGVSQLPAAASRCACCAAARRESAALCGGGRKHAQQSGDSGQGVAYLNLAGPPGAGWRSHEVRTLDFVGHSQPASCIYRPPELAPSNPC